MVWETRLCSAGLSLALTLVLAFCYIDCGVGAFDPTRPLRLFFLYRTLLSATGIIGAARILEGDFSHKRKLLRVLQGELLQRTVLAIPGHLCIYYICNLRHGFHHFIVFMSALTVQSACNLSFNGLFSTIFLLERRSISILMIVVTAYLLLTMLFSGSLRNPLEVTWILRWIEFLIGSFYASQMMSQNELGGLGNVVLVGGGSTDGSTTTGSTTTTTGDLYLKVHGLAQIPLWGAFGAALGVAVTVTALTLLIFHLKKCK